MPKKIYRTMQGKMIDMESIMTKHETMPAVGNAKMNARGDELGPGGKIIKTREAIMAEYYENDPDATPRRAVKPAVVEPVEEVAPEPAPVEVKTRRSSKEKDKE